MPGHVQEFPNGPKTIAPDRANKKKVLTKTTKDKTSTVQK